MQIFASSKCISMVSIPSIECTYVRKYISSKKNYFWRNDFGARPPPPPAPPRRPRAVTPAPRYATETTMISHQRYHWYYTRKPRFYFLLSLHSCTPYQISYHSFIPQTGAAVYSIDQHFKPFECFNGNLVHNHPHSIWLT